jgi:plastocyanin
MGGDHLNANGCTFQTADDETGQSTLAMDIWGLPYQQCVIVEVGTTLTWNGSFDVHPLTGGVIPTEDVSSPISAKMGVGDFEYTFDTAGDYPFFCGVHLGAMQGVVYVIDP